MTPSGSASSAVSTGSGSAGACSAGSGYGASNDIAFERSSGIGRFLFVDGDGRIRPHDGLLKVRQRQRLLARLGTRRVYQHRQRLRRVSDGHIAILLRAEGPVIGEDVVNLFACHSYSFSSGSKTASTSRCRIMRYFVLSTMICWPAAQENVTQSPILIGSR